MKTVRVRCRYCGERFSYTRCGAGRPPVYCDGCKQEAYNEKAAQRVAAMRHRKRAVSV